MKILITGINGQDGSNMAKFILKNNFGDVQIFGTMRENSNTSNIINIIDNLNIVYLNLINANEIEKIFVQILPDMIFHFASAQPQTENNNVNLFAINTLSTINFLECINNYKKNCKFLSAGSSMEIGNSNANKFVNLNSVCNPDTIYGISKLTNRQMINFYREKYSLFVVHVVLFSHESIARNDVFLTKKIANQLCNIYKSINNNDSFDPIEIGNIYSMRDWSDSNDFVEAMWSMLNVDASNNYILSSGEEHSVKEYIDLCCTYINFKNLKWVINEKNNDFKLYSNDILIIKTNINLFRNNDFSLIGDNEITKQQINWTPKITFDNMVKNIIDDVIS